MAPTQQNVLITGCSDGGIGSALAIVFQQRGLHVFATARKVEKMGKLKDLPHVTLLTLDVTKSADIRAAVKIVTEKTGNSLDYLVNNAGLNHFSPILDEDTEKIKETFDTNFFAPIHLTQAFAPLLIKAKGAIVFITSVAGYLNIPYMATYSASKRAIETVAETLRLEIAPFGVDVLSIPTGAVQSRGQTYFDDFTLPEQSLYKSIEDILKSRAQGKHRLARMDAIEYATAVVDEILKRTTGKFWYGVNAEMVKMSTTATAVPQSAMDARALHGTGLDALRK